MDDRQFKELTVRLDKLMRIIALSSTRGLTMTDRITLLDQCNLRPSEIASVVGTTPESVSTILSRARRAKKHVKGKGGDNNE